MPVILGHTKPFYEGNKAGGGKRGLTYTAERRKTNIHRRDGHANLLPILLLINISMFYSRIRLDGQHIL